MTELIGRTCLLVIDSVLSQRLVMASESRIVMLEFARGVNGVAAPPSANSAGNGTDGDANRPTRRPHGGTQRCAANPSHGARRLLVEALEGLGGWKRRSRGVLRIARVVSVVQTVVLAPHRRLRKRCVLMNLATCVPRVIFMRYRLPRLHLRPSSTSLRECHSADYLRSPSRSFQQLAPRRSSPSAWTSRPINGSGTKGSTTRASTRSPVTSPT